MTILNCRDAWEKMTALSAQNDQRNYTQVLDMSDYVVETDLFPKDVLEAYSAWNLEQPLNEKQKSFFNDQRGGGQGDYRLNMGQKIANVVSCLTEFPQSKRAVITISNHPTPDHHSDEQAKCLREIHFYLDAKTNQLNATCLFRAQAALIFPKNIHFIGSLMQNIAQQLPKKPALGQLFYLTTVLVSDRS